MSVASSPYKDLLLITLTEISTTKVIFHQLPVFSSPVNNAIGHLSCDVIGCEDSYSDWLADVILDRPLVSLFFFNITEKSFVGFR